MKIGKWIKRIVWSIMLGAFAYSGFIMIEPLMKFEGFEEGATVFIVGFMFVCVFLLMLSIALSDISRE